MTTGKQGKVVVTYCAGRHSIAPFLDEKMHKQGAKGSLRKWLLHAFVVAPLLAVLALRVLDYNRFIQIPYWTVFSVCYLLPAANLSVCQMESIDAITSWTIAQWNWSLEPVQPGTITPVPEIEAKDFSYELLDKLSHGFTIPVVARGLFADSPVSSRLLPCDPDPLTHPVLLCLRRL